MFLGSARAIDEKMLQLRGKAVDIKSMVRAMCHVWDGIMDRENVHHRVIRQGLMASAKADEILKDFPAP
eukprot:3558952-Karenia_brevis.AAC.1